MEINDIMTEIIWLQCQAKLTIGKNIQGHEAGAMVVPNKKKRVLIEEE